MLGQYDNIHVILVLYKYSTTHETLVQVRTILIEGLTMTTSTWVFFGYCHVEPKTEVLVQTSLLELLHL
jgi:hypothetical protein